ncbi:MAG TPA: vWA domain-containing protein [Nannocystaceae bacterium]|nr:vWA domain-containing protein [Nannocystaceae bacterium]
MIAACGGGREEEGDGSGSFTTTNATTLTTTDPATTGGSGDEESMSGPMESNDSIGKLDVAGADNTSGGTGEECAAIEEEGMVGLQPADIIVIVDNSGSMEFEANSVQNYLNMFSSQIFLANIDAHVVLISSYPNVGHGICLDPPLGSGGCPADDNNPPGYTHVNQEVDSNNALQILISTQPMWAGAMRATASKHIIVVTDDESDLDAASFTAMWAALDPTYSPFSFHAIAALQDPVSSCIDGNASGCCAISAAAGFIYHELVNNTGGVWGNLCEQEFQPIFDEVATAVVQGSAIACEFTIPPPPDGEEFDPGEVNVEFNDGVGTLEIGYVEGLADCAGVTNGWYYDDPANPTTILLCPQTCETIQGFEMAQILIGFGCATVPAG